MSLYISQDPCVATLVSTGISLLYSSTGSLVIMLELHLWQPSLIPKVSDQKFYFLPAPFKYFHWSSSKTWGGRMMDVWHFTFQRTLRWCFHFPHVPVTPISLFLQFFRLLTSRFWVVISPCYSFCLERNGIIRVSLITSTYFFCFWRNETWSK